MSPRFLSVAVATSLTNFSLSIHFCISADIGGKGKDGTSNMALPVVVVVTFGKREEARGGVNSDVEAPPLNKYTQETVANQTSGHSH